ncbi:MAG: TIGR03885 family FMN-dependent LLM class oxidoreductase [Chloroflexota bacterium]|nr:TIGR03885 family FMN-dependent LLM class oxidoreductase [Chloroflexota bacterium]
MATIGYHASHEQFAPGELLEHVRHAEQAGFSAAMCSDHIAPWSESQGHSGFAWSWLGAALQATNLSYGTVNAPGDRYHPAIVAQAAATLAEMFPDRFWVALGTGQASNEHVTGQRWPIKAERNARLRECVDIIRALWAGETVTHRGRVTVEEAKIWSLPERPPLIVGPALSEATAEFVGSWADAFVTVAAPRPQLQRMIEAFRRGGGEDKPMYLQSHISWAGSEAEARANAFDQWRTPIFAGEVNEHLRTPAQFDAAARFVRPDELDDFIRISADPERHCEFIHEDLSMGFERVYIHNVGRNQREFIEAFGERVLSSFA